MKLVVEPGPADDTDPDIVMPPPKRSYTVRMVAPDPRDAEIDALRAELARLREIVGRLDKTRDGMPITRGMLVYRMTRLTEKIEEHTIAIHARAIVDKYEIDWPATDCYSTRAAAEAAARKGAEDGK